MPFLRSRIVAILIPLIAVLAGVLYVIHTGTVHVSTQPPAALARLVLNAQPQAAPVVGFSEAAGKRETLASFRGHYVLLNLWATWCAPCVRELPQLAQLKSAIPSLQVVAVNVGRDDTAQTAAFLKTHDAGLLTVYVDTDAALIRAFGAEGLPFTVIIDPDGREIAHAMGPCDWIAAGAVNYLRMLIRSASRAAS